MADRFRPVALEHASRLINHGPTVLVTSTSGGRPNVMAAAWSMPVEFTPPRIAVVIDKHTFTRELVMASGAFALCIPGAALVDLLYAVGSESGRDGDKFARRGIVATAGPVLGMPLVESGCSAWLECRLISEPHTATHRCAAPHCRTATTTLSAATATPPAFRLSALAAPRSRCGRAERNLPRDRERGRDGVQIEDFADEVSAPCQEPKSNPVRIGGRPLQRAGAGLATARWTALAATM